MKINILLIIFLLFFVSSLSVLGISLQDAVETSLEKNPEIKSLDNAKSRALQYLENAKHPWESNIGLAATYQNTAVISNGTTRTGGDQTNLSFVYNLKYSAINGSVLDMSTSPVATGSSSTSLRLSARFPLIQGAGRYSSRSFAVESAKSSLSRTEYQNWLSIQNMIYGVTMSYMNAVLSGQQIKIQEDTLTSTKRSAEDAQKRADEQLIAGIEVQRAQIRVAQQEDQLSKTYQNYYQNLENLKISIGQGIPEITDVDLDSIPDVSNIILPSEEEATEKAIANRKQLAMYDIEISDMQRDYDRANDNLKNALSAYATINNNGTDNFIINDNFWNNRNILIGIEYTIPLDQKILKNQKETIKKDLDYKVNTKDYEIEKISAEVHSAFLSIEQAKQSIVILTKNIEIAEQNVYVAKRMVEEGLSSNREVLDAEDSLLMAKSNLLSAKISIYTSVLNLKKAMGDDILELIKK